MYDYSTFVANVRKRIKDGQDRDKAVEAAVDDAINGKLLEGLFEEQKWDIIGMMLAEFDKELYEKTIREEAAQQKAIEDAVKTVIKYHATPEEAAADMGAPLDKVLEALQTQPHPAEV